MASNEQSFERNDDNNSQNERDSVESESYIDQTDLNFLVQKWLDALTVLHREPVEYPLNMVLLDLSVHAVIHEKNALWNACVCVCVCVCLCLHGIGICNTGYMFSVVL
jgi:hypothetical protein